MDNVRTLRARWAAPILAAIAIAPLGALPAAAVPAAPASEPDRSPSAPIQSYVALGDSYAGGRLIPPQIGVPAGCERSGRNYPTFVAETLGIKDFQDASCAGPTTTEFFTSPQPVPGGVNPPQFDRLTPDTDLVTLTIGGFDIGFDEILRECSTRSPQQPTGTACVDFYDRDGVDVIDGRIEATAADIDAALAGIAERSPDARVLVVGYPTLLPDSGPGCFPELPLSPGDVAYLRGVEKKLNAMLADRADAADVEYVDTYTPSIGHDLCTPPGYRWIEGFRPVSPAAPVTFNALGMSQVARIVAEAIVDADD
ncbi:hypothetical protein BJF78_14140 [Pseudonocardia sp. CNS-139]|nr:hypothetical protein BJF78_14140 [Pseudonocardia sp. CNS-139]